LRVETAAFVEVDFEEVAFALDGCSAVGTGERGTGLCGSQIHI
jgi:hypothetical protein